MEGIILSNFINLSQKSRPYKIDVYGLQDNYLGCLQPYNGSIIGQVSEPKIELSTDGTQTFTCSIPKFYINPKTNQKEQNPHWVDIDNGVLAENTRILKVFVNYENEIKVYPFIVDKITDARDSHFSVFRKIEASGLAFAELGKVGYKLELTQDSLLLEQEEKPEEDIVPTINYWLDKVFPSEEITINNKAYRRWLTPWCYEIKMDWSDYSEEGRLPTKIYEDSYVSSWGLSQDKTELIPEGFEIGKERAAIINCSNSNKYNITQSIAEAYNVFCSYEYKTSTNGSFVGEYIENDQLWTGRKVIFYNKAIKKDNPFYIQYQKNSNSISRESDSSEIFTKLYIPKIESSVSSTGLISIADTPVNPLRDEFILNFDYLYNIGSITEYQKKVIKDYEVQIRSINDALIEIAPSIETVEEELNDLKTKQKFYDNEAQQAASEHKTYQNYYDSIVGDEPVTRNKSNPYSIIFVENNNNKEAQIRLEGVNATTIKGYKESYEDSNIIFQGSQIIGVTQEHQVSEVDADKFYLLSDKFGWPIKIYTHKNNLELKDVSLVLLEVSYYPKNAYEQICKTLKETVEVKNGLALTYKTKIQEKETTLEELLNEQERLLEEKEKLHLRLEKILGPALREGYWNPDTSYEDPGNRKILLVNQDKESGLFFDEVPFEGEPESFYYATAENLSNEVKTFYDYINISSLANVWKNKNLTKLVLHLKEPKGETEVGKILEERLLYPNAGFIFGFFKDNKNAIIPVLVLNDNNIKYSYYQKISYSFLDDEDSEKETTLAIESNAQTQYNLYYPRIKIEEYNVDFISSRQKLFLGDIETGLELENYVDYSVLLRKGYPHYTLKITEKLNIYNILNPNFSLIYIISRANEMLYLDAKEVAFENSRPRYSYEVEVVNIPSETTNCELGQLVYINDYSLGMHHVSGYIDTISLALDQPSKDEITIKNYKTKFEDLFGTITATSEAMRNNQHSYDIAASGFTAGGTINGDILQSSIDNNNIAFNFSGTNVTIDDTDGILLTNTSAYSNGVYGQVALRGGGIFLSNSVDDVGERVWGTGITPSGINASYLRAGQIDTNLIKIYSGNNVAFQWNGEGIFAYVKDSNGIPNLSQYVRYSENGLQYVNNEHTTVDLGWNGLLISTQGGSTELTGENGLVVYYGEKNEQGTNYAVRVGKFIDNNIESYGIRLYNKIDENTYIPTLVSSNSGQLWLKDTLRIGQDSSGNLGIAGITGEGITEYNEETDEAISPIRFWAGNSIKEQAPFWVKEDGTLQASQATISGTIYAQNGSFSGHIEAITGMIGGWEIKENGLRNSDGTVKLLPTGEFKVGDNFFVSPGGDAIIKGDITANTGHIGSWIIDENKHLRSEDGLTVLSGEGAEADSERINVNNKFIAYANGSIEAVEATISGNITAKTGKIGQWEINDYGLIGAEGSVGLYSGNAGSYKIGDSYIRFWAGKSGEDSIYPYNFCVTDNGKLLATQADITGKIVAESGFFSNSFFVGSETGKQIFISGSTESGGPFIGSSQYASGPLGFGWRINYDGSAEFENVSIRGKISSAVFEHNRISSIGGSLYIAPTFYIEVESETIENNQVIWYNTAFDPKTTCDREWLDKEQIKLDGSLYKIIDGKEENLEISNIQATLITEDIAEGQVKLKLPDIPSINGYRFRPGAAVVFYGTNTRRSGLFLTSVGKYSPYLEIYDNDGTEDPIPAVRLGNLEGITDTYIVSSGGLTGYGLYSSNAYLRGELRLPNAGVTNQMISMVNNSPVRIWAGTESDISNANFIVTEDGSLYAKQGTFEGVVKATNSEFSGSIRAAGILLEEEDISASDSLHNHFYVAYNLTEEGGEFVPSYKNYVLNIDKNGLSIWEGGLRAYSDLATEQTHIVYSQANGYGNLPYLYLVDDITSNKELFSRIVFNKSHQISFNNNTIQSIILDSGIWFKNQNWSYTKNDDFETQEKIIFSSDRESGIYLNEGILTFKNAKSIKVEATNLIVEEEIQIKSDKEPKLVFNKSVIKEVKNSSGTAIGLDFIAIAE